MKAKISTMLNSALENFDRASILLGDEYPSDLVQKLRHPKERTELRLSPQFSDRRIR